MKLGKLIGFSGSIACALRDSFIASLGLTPCFMRGVSLSVRVMKVSTSLRDEGENKVKFRGCKLHDELK